ncbi:hypothetical protein ACFO3D_07385 [Virgibacillus kekensis]|uniref:DUF4233 domain-containing protein n=1 Tax=Virgibacillus kekensis TaxID=202261 RepID=A0ABV9DGR2_9BACI
MTLSRIMKFITGGAEAFLGIPFIGGAYILGTGWTPLLVMFVLHLITVVIAYRDRGSIAGNILGMITSVVGVIPIVGMIMHIITAIVILIDAIIHKK